MKIGFRSNTIVLMGDTHSLLGTFNLIGGDLSLSARDIVFLGDGGEGFGPFEQDEKKLGMINELCKARGIMLICIRGNHTNPRFWSLNLQFSNVFLAPDYTEAVFPNGDTALLVGGGVSIDRSFRVPGIDYWPDEVTVYQKINKQFNYLFAHDCPDYFNWSTESLKTSPYAPVLLGDTTLLKDALNQRNVMSNIVADIKPKKCFSGHFHNNQKGHNNGVLYQCLNIDEKYVLDVAAP